MMGTPLGAEVVEELPVQFQARGYSFSVELLPGKRRRLTYSVTERGRYAFGRVNVFVSTRIGLVQRRYESDDMHEAAVYPSFVQLEKYELFAATRRHDLLGLKQVRRLGHAMEFEHVREYVRGDYVRMLNWYVRMLNWRATARRGDLLVNQNQDEHAQPIYAVFDTGRAMKMPFDGMALLDYAINAALVLAGVAVKKGDMAGIVSYSNRVHQIFKAERRAAQMGQILEALHNLTTDFAESDLQQLYASLRTRLPRRSLRVLFTNYESVSGLQRHLPELARLAQHHVVLTVLFENTGLEALTGQTADSLDAVYVGAIAQQFADEKHEIARVLRQHGVMTLLTTPAALTLDVVNRYLELKAQHRL